MKIRSYIRQPFKSERGFTLIELLVVMAIIALLAALTMGGFKYAQQASSRNRSTASLAAIKSGLEQYKEKFGEYPDLSSTAESEQGDYGGLRVNKGGALMLYQALTGDGNNFIELAASTTTTSSDGVVDTDELANSVTSALPPQMVFSAGQAPGTDGPRFLVDGFGRPFQYSKDPTTSVNPTYDLWSFGNTETLPGSPYSLTTKKSATSTGTWIKNW